MGKINPNQKVQILKTVLGRTDKIREFLNKCLKNCTEGDTWHTMFKKHCDYYNLLSSSLLNLILFWNLQRRTIEVLNDVEGLDLSKFESLYSKIDFSQFYINASSPPFRFAEIIEVFQMVESFTESCYDEKENYLRQLKVTIKEEEKEGLKNYKTLYDYKREMRERQEKL